MQMVYLFMPVFGAAALVYGALVIGSLFYDFMKESIDRVDV